MRLPNLQKIATLVCGLAVWAGGDRAAAQEPSSWYFLEGPERITLPVQSDSGARRETMERLLVRGHYFAEVDSITSDGSGRRVWATPGPRYAVGEIRIEGAETISADALRLIMQTREGEPLLPAILEEDVGRILRRYELRGRPLASVVVEAVEPVSPGGTELQVRLRIREGTNPVLRDVAILGNARTRPAYLARVAGLRPGSPIRSFDAEALQGRLLATGFFRSVEEPVLNVLPDSSVVMLFRLREEAPGAFDLVIGFLPPTTAGGSLAVVGNGHLELNNLLGGGRRIALRLDRLPDQAGSVDALIADPFVLGLPVGVEAQYSAFQRDSTYTRQRYGLEISVRLAPGVHGFVSGGREVTRPGVGAGDLVSRADAVFAGVGMRVRRVDNPSTPTRGYALEVAAESGRKSRSTAVDAQPQREQDRARLSARYYLPLSIRHILALGVDAASLLRGAADQSDLIRFGGATTLRGYDEDRFLARTAGRGLVEYRYLLDPISYVFAFLDIGYVEAPALRGVSPVEGVRPGYGIGIRFETAVGLVSASYAMSGEAGPANGRIHVGLSFGL